MTTTKYSKQNQETAAGTQDDLVHLRFELFGGTSAEAYITYFKFNRRTINLCVRPSTNAFDIVSPELSSSRLFPASMVRPDMFSCLFDREKKNFTLGRILTFCQE